MTKQYRVFALVVLCSFLFNLPNDLIGQTRSRSSKKSTELTSHLWYGGGLGLGFQSFNQQSSFLFALFPMVGYKITEDISIGPRIGLSYQYLKTRGFDGKIYKFNPIEISGAFFARAKVFEPIFAHVEYEVANEKRPVYNGVGIPSIAASIQNNFYIGAGYNSGGKIASEIYVLYNVNQDDTSLDVPFVIRGGFTFNF